MDIKALVVTDLGKDILGVQAVVDAFPDRVFEARGWVSATTNHFDMHPNPEGQDAVASTGRAMDEDEVRAYAVRLLAEQHPNELAGLVKEAEPAVLIAENPEHL